MAVNEQPVDFKFDQTLHNAKVTLNGLHEARRRSLSPTKFVYYSNARVTKFDRHSEEITLTIDKPIEPPESLIG